MKIFLAATSIALLCAGCSENTMGGTGANSTGDTTSGTIRERSDGTYALLVTVDGGACSAVYRDPRPDGRELRPLSCTGGQGGNATVIYDGAGVPRSATYGGTEIGSGTVRF